MQTVFVNGRFLTQTVTGVQRYCHELMRGLDRLASRPGVYSGIRFECLAPPQAFPEPGWTHIAVRRVGRNRGNLWEQLDLAAHLKDRMLFSPAGIGPWHYRNQIVTFHDASVFAAPSAYTAAFRLKHTFVLSRLARRAKLILTVSRFSQAELARYLRAPIGRFQVIPLGADHLDRIRADDSSLERNALTKEGYLFLVASLSPRKNIQAVLEAVKLTRREPKIVIAGTPTDRRIFRSPQLNGLDAVAVLLGYLQDSELKALYQNALGFVLPSTYEGFGLPVLEAMRCGCPVLASTAAALPEVAGQAALYFDPLQSRSAASAIQTLTDDPRLRDDLRRRGAQRAALFTWDETARRTLEAIASAPEA